MALVLGTEGDFGTDTLRVASSQGTPYHGDSSHKYVAHVVSAYVMSVVHIVALVVSASSKKSAASVIFVASASLVAFETVRLETSEETTSSSISLLMGYLATAIVTPSA
uniref:Uncharacterized protein n=1 Tax=Cannabis sativa TaxID=3483 RepID=A0A803NPE9_CANSA